MSQFTHLNRKIDLKLDRRRPLDDFVLSVSQFYARNNFVLKSLGTLVCRLVLQKLSPLCFHFLLLM